MNHQLPEGWQRMEDEAGLVFYLTRHPQVKISKRCHLESYHRKGRYKEMKLSDLDFGVKKRAKKYSLVQPEISMNQERHPGSRNTGQDSSSERSSVSEKSAPGCLDWQWRNEASKFIPDLTCDESDADIELERGEKVRKKRRKGAVLESGCDELEPRLDEELDQRLEREYGAARMEKPLLSSVMISESESDEDVDGREKSVEKVNIKRRKKAHLENEKNKLEKAVKKLTLNREEVVEHREALADAAKSLNDARKSLGANDLDKVDLDSIKSKIETCKTADELVMILNTCTELHKELANVEHSKILEQLLSISSHPDNPLSDFPLDINKNHYSDIIGFALKHSPDVLGLVLRLVTKNEAPIAHNDVVRCAYMYSSLASSVSRLNNALKKTKSASTKNNGITNNGLDLLANIGVFETSRSYRNDRDFLASLSDHILKSYAQFSVPHITFDNMDLSVGHVMHHMTLPFLEFEIEDTTDLPTDEKSFEEALEYFRMETVLITSDQNQTLFDHFKYVVAWTLGRIFGEEVEGFSWLRKVFPKHYKHPNSSTSSRKSTIFTQKPLNFSENNNREMILIMENLQRLYLNLVAEQSNDKEAYLKDLKLIYSVDLEKGVREAAEKRIKEEVKKAGELICHGDLLTDVRFETCKRLRRMAVTAVERFDFLKIFRLGTFHLAMNKIIQDIQAGMKSEVNVEDTLSLGYFKTILGLHHITNNPDVIKKDGNYEHHAQFCDDIGKELLIEAFKTFVDDLEEDLTDKTEHSAVELILKFLKTMDIKFYYDHENFEETKKHDDMMSSCKDNASRTLLSLVLHSVEHEGDGLGLRAIRTVMIPYMLNRKEHIQDSKYAPRLLFNKIWFLQASQRTQARIDLLACCNPSGKPGHSIARDQENEHKVKSTKNILRGLHSQLGDLPVEKAVLGSNIMDIIEGHDKQAMMVIDEGGKSSCRYLSPEQKTKIREEIRKMKPFNYQREKICYFDKTRGIFSGLAVDQVERFLLRNKVNFTRNSPHKAFLVDEVAETATDVKAGMEAGDGCMSQLVINLPVEKNLEMELAEQESDEKMVEAETRGQLEMSFGSDDLDTAKVNF